MPKLFTPDWMTLKEASTKLSCDPKTVINRIRRGDLPVRVIRLDRVVRLNRKDFAQALDALAVMGRSA
jgi:hypothetical protein